MKKFVQYRNCSETYGQYYPFLILHSQEPEASPRAGSCGCFAERSESARDSRRVFTPTEPNPTQQRAVINYGDKQHCLAWSLHTGCCYV